MRKDPRTRFEAKVKKTDSCWLWEGCLYNKSTGYGAFKYEGKAVLTHRFAWFLEHGYWPDILVCHTCDVRLCVNPNHLFLGTHKDNHDDMTRKGRVEYKNGYENKNSKFTEDDAKEFYRLSTQEGKSYREIARKYNTSHKLVSRYIKYYTNK